MKNNAAERVYIINMRTLVKAGFARIRTVNIFQTGRGTKIVVKTGRQVNSIEID